MGFTRRRFPKYDPASDGSLTMWLDPSNSTKLLAVGGGAISNGATIGTWNTSGGTARAFTQWGSNARPTWDSTGINGLGAVRCNSQILSTTTITGFASMTSIAFIVACKRSAAGGASIGFTQIDGNTGQYDISLLLAFIDSVYDFGGRRTTLESFQTISGNTAPSIYILGGVLDYTNAKGYLFESGVKGTQGAAFQTTGTTGAGEPHVISVGGFAQQTGNSAMTPDDLVAPFAYMRLKWGGNAF
jgi:hypothetical protein